MGETEPLPQSRGSNQKPTGKKPFAMDEAIISE